MTQPGEAQDQTPSVDSVLRQAFEAPMSNVRIGLPGEVVSFDSSAGKWPTVTVQVGVTRRDGTPVSPLQAVPVCYQRFGPFIIYAPLEPGDTGWIRFGERDISRWIRLGDIRQAPSERRFDWSDAVFEPDVSPHSRPLPTTLTTADKLYIGAEDQSARINFDPSIGRVEVEAATDIKLGLGATDFVALAAKVLTEFAAVKAAYDVHTHGHGVGPGVTTIPAPLLPTPGSTAATKTRAE